MLDETLADVIKKNERKEKETFHTDLKRVKKNSLPGECSITRRQSFFLNLKAYLLGKKDKLAF